MFILNAWIAKVTNTLANIETKNVASLITAASGVTINSAYMYIYSKRVAQLYLSVTFSSNQTADTSYDIGTLNTAIRPVNIAALGSTYGAGQITSGGVISFRPQMNLNAGSNRFFASTFILASLY